MKETWVFPSDGSEPYERSKGPPADRMMIFGDIEPFRSPDGQMIMGRAQWREHLKATDTIEMGHSDVKYAQTEWLKKKEAKGIHPKKTEAPEKTLWRGSMLTAVRSELSTNTPTSSSIRRRRKEVATDDGIH